MLEAIGLTKCYAIIPAVSHVSFAVRPGESWATWDQTALEKARR
jgi:ABC-type multidrug transport system ATPase subunit